MKHGTQRGRRPWPSTYDVEARDISSPVNATNSIHLCCTTLNFQTKDGTNTTVPTYHTLLSPRSTHLPRQPCPRKLMAPQLTRPCTATSHRSRTTTRATQTTRRKRECKEERRQEEEGCQRCGCARYIYFQAVPYSDGIKRLTMVRRQMTLKSRYS